MAPELGNPEPLPHVAPAADNTGQAAACGWSDAIGPDVPPLRVAFRKLLLVMPQHDRSLALCRFTTSGN
jgi:hypothetical protein